MPKKGEELPLWHDDEYDDRDINIPPTELGRHSSSDTTKGQDAFDPEKALPQVTSERPLKPARCPPETTFYDYIPLFKAFKWMARAISSRARARPERRRRRKAYDGYVESHIPLEIVLVLSKCV